MYNTKRNQPNNLKNIVIFYPNVKNKTVKDRLGDLQPLFNSILNSDPNSNIDLFMEQLGELSFELYRMLFARRGNAGIVEWLIRALAQAKNVNLGPRATNNPLPPDFEAFLTSEKKEYAQWFKNHAFVRPTLSPSSQQAEKINQPRSLNDICFASRPIVELNFCDNGIKEQFETMTSNKAPNLFFSYPSSKKEELNQNISLEENISLSLTTTNTLRTVLSVIIDGKKQGAMFIQDKKKEQILSLYDNPEALIALLKTWGESAVSIAELIESNLSNISALLIN